MDVLRRPRVSPSSAEALGLLHCIEKVLEHGDFDAGVFASPRSGKLAAIRMQAWGASRPKGPSCDLCIDLAARSPVDREHPQFLVGEHFAQENGSPVRCECHRVVRWNTLALRHAV